MKPLRCCSWSFRTFREAGLLYLCWDIATTAQEILQAQHNHMSNWLEFARMLRNTSYITLNRFTRRDFIRTQYEQRFVLKANSMLSEC